GVGLLLHDFGHGRTHARRKADAVDRHALLLGVHHADEIVRARQAAGVGGEKPLGAADHRLASPSARSASRSFSAPSTLPLISAEASSASRSSSALTRRTWSVSERDIRAGCVSVRRRKRRLRSTSVSRMRWSVLLCAISAKRSWKLTLPQ